jgi:sulfoacetaldehyde dehydrogenase
MALHDVAAAADRSLDEDVVIAELMARARAAQGAFARADQATVDDAVTAVAWTIYQPTRARELAEIAVRDTGLGNVRDKVAKNQRKTFGTLRDLLAAKSVGIIEEDPARGIVKYAKPMGVVAAICPSTNPAATPANKAMMALKGRNAVIVAPSPAGYTTTSRLVEMIRAELARAGHNPDLVQCLPAPMTKALTQKLMAAADLVVATGSQDNVRRAYSSGTPAIGVGAGNAPVIIDESADLPDAARKIERSKTFDNATSCSSENALVILEPVYEKAINALAAVGAYRASAEEREAIRAALWQDGKLNRKLIAKDADVFAERVGLGEAARGARFFLVEEERVERPFADEKLSLVLTVYKAKDFAEAKRMVNQIMAIKGRGHSVGIHTKDLDHARELAEELDTVRVLVNQAHAIANGGSFDNGLDFTLSMGCGTWGGNSISENLSWRHFINVTHLVTTIPERRPSERELFGGYFERHGR